MHICKPITITFFETYSTGFSHLTLLPAIVFLRRLLATVSKITLRHISSSNAYSDKIPTATPMFSGSISLVVVLPISWDVNVC